MCYLESKMKLLIVKSLYTIRGNMSSRCINDHDTIGLSLV